MRSLIILACSFVICIAVASACHAQRYSRGYQPAGYKLQPAAVMPQAAMPQAMMPQAAAPQAAGGALPSSAELAAPPIQPPAGFHLMPGAQQRPAANKLDELKDGHNGYNLGDVADTPTGADKLYFTFITSADWQTDTGPRGKAQKAVRAWLESEPRLVKYWNESNSVWLLENDEAYTGMRTLANGQASSLKMRFGEAYPIVAVESSDGELLFKMSAASLASNAGELGDWVTAAIKRKASSGGFKSLLNPPDFRGKSLGTPVITEGGAHFGGAGGTGDFFTGWAGQCGPDGCPNDKPTPHDGSEVLDDTPRPDSTTTLILCVLGSILFILACLAITATIAGAAHFFIRPRTA